MPKIKTLGQQEDRGLDRPWTLVRYIAPQRQDWTGEKYAATIDHPESKLNIDDNERLARQLTIESATQKVLR